MRLVTIVDPGVKVDPGYDVFEEGDSLGMFCRDRRGARVDGVVWPGRAAFPDLLTRATLRSWWAGHYGRLAEAGISGFWHDMNEPSSMSLLGDPTLPIDTLHDLDGRGGDHSEAHNLYGLLMNEAGFEGLKAARPEVRPFIVSRSGWASNQRWAWNWTGDVDSTWEAMRQQVATATGLGLCGIAFCGSDIGGFSGVPDDELYLRWLQMSVFMGFCRTHSVVGVPPREPWRFGRPTRSRIGAWIRLRYRLLPYLYTLAHQAALTGSPLVRPVWWPDPSGRQLSASEHESLSSIDDEFLLGDHLLVAPVHTKGATSRAVVLPPGGWTSLWATGTRSHWSDVVSRTSVDVGGEVIPVLVRAGTILPLDDAFADPSGACALEGDFAVSARPDRPDRSVRQVRQVRQVRSDRPDRRDPPSRRERTDGPDRPVHRLDHAPITPSFHCWADAEGAAKGTCIDDSGDGDGATRRDDLELVGASDGRTAVLTMRSTGEFPMPERVRIVLHGFESPSVRRDGHDLGSTTAGMIECAPFDRLELTDLIARDPASGASSK